MSAVTTAAGSGVVLGIVIVFLLQQFGRIAFNGFLLSLLLLVAAGIVGGVIFGVAAWATARRASRRT
jgi:NhaP-type Na+/H+ or K+/H+ antiporter